MLRKFYEEEADFFFWKKSARGYQELFLGAQLSRRSVTPGNGFHLLIDDPGDFSIILELGNAFHPYSRIHFIGVFRIDHPARVEERFDLLGFIFHLSQGVNRLYIFHGLDQLIHVVRPTGFLDSRLEMVDICIGDLDVLLQRNPQLFPQLDERKSFRGEGNIPFGFWDDSQQILKNRRQTAEDGLTMR